MTIDSARLRDEIETVLASRRPHIDRSALVGHGTYELIGPDGELKASGKFKNLVTQVGDQYYGERAAGLGAAPAVVTGMQLGTGTTTPTKTGAAAALGTLVAASLVALSGVPTSTLNGAARRISYAVTWAAGVATANAIAEVVLVNQSTGTQTVAPASATIARALISPTVNKAAGDTLNVTWHHDLTGA